MDSIKLEKKCQSNLEMHFGSSQHKDSSSSDAKSYYQILINIISKECNLYLQMTLDEYYNDNEWVSYFFTIIVCMISSITFFGIL